MSVMKKILVLLLSFAMLLGVAATAVAADDSEELVWYDCDCAHTHTDECYDGDALICEKEELHVHTKDCFESGWPNKKKVFEPICGKGKRNAFLQLYDKGGS